jgi:hypothetical protein
LCENGALLDMLMLPAQLYRFLGGGCPFARDSRFCSSQRRSVLVVARFSTIAVM